MKRHPGDQNEAREVRGETPLPRYVQIEPVGQCNLRCTMCPIQFRKDARPAFMAFETFARLVEGFPSLTELHLQGLGEPMMHPHVFDMVRFAAARGVRVTTNTNFTLVGPRRAERLVTSGLDGLHVSIDGATAKTYESIRIRGRLDRVLRNLRLFAEARGRRGGAAPRLRLVMVVMRRNLQELPAVVRLAADVGAVQVFVQHLCHEYGEEALPLEYQPMRGFVEAETLAREDPALVERVFESARVTGREIGVDVRLPQVRPRLHPAGTPGRQRCQWPWSGAYVSYQGLAMPCCMISTPDRQNFGNMATSGVAATWHGASYEAFRRKLDSDDPPDVCRSCAIYKGTF